MLTTDGGLTRVRGRFSTYPARGSLARRLLRPWAVWYLARRGGNVFMSLPQRLLFDWAIWARYETIERHPWVVTALIYWRYHMPWNRRRPIG